MDAALAAVALMAVAGALVVICQAVVTTLVRGNRARQMPAPDVPTGASESLRDLRTLRDDLRAYELWREGR